MVCTKVGLSDVIFLRLLHYHGICCDSVEQQAVVLRDKVRYFYTMWDNYLKNYVSQ